MNINRQFKEVEESFFQIRKQFRRKDISRREFIDRLKKLRIRDDQGRFWMIGAQSGKWYYFDGKDWIQSDVPSEGKEGILCPQCGQGNPPGAAVCEKCGESMEQTKLICPECGRPLEDPMSGCPFCQETFTAPGRMIETQAVTIPHGRVAVKRLDPLSTLLFMGSFGAVSGIIFGALSGASEYFSGFAKSLPSFLSEIHGTITGGIVFGFTGGITGFVLGALLGFISAWLFNVISSFVGGLKLEMEPHVPRIRDEIEEKTSSDDSSPF